MPLREEQAGLRALQAQVTAVSGTHIHSSVCLLVCHKVHAFVQALCSKRACVLLNHAVCARAHECAHACSCKHVWMNA